MVCNLTSANKLDAARALLIESRTVAAFSGAGLSAESGLATFRDPDANALWARFDPTELASVSGFEANPERVIEWYNWRRAQLARVSPNAAHRALAGQSRMFQITQNVDNLLEQAGARPQQVYHLHGSILNDRCHRSTCDYHETVDLEAAPALRSCPRCAAPLRPAVVWFGENLPGEAWSQARQLCTRIDCLLVIGTSTSVYPAAGLVDLTRAQGSQVVVVNPDPAAADNAADLHLQYPAGEVLPGLLDGLDLVSNP